MGCGEAFLRYESWRNQELIDTTPKELWEDDLTEMSASKPVLYNEEEHIE